MPSTNIALNTDNCLYKSDGTYLTARNGATGSTKTDYNYVGQHFGPPLYEYTVYRSFLTFDTSGFESGTLFKSATLRLKGYEVYGQRTDFQIIIKNGQPTYPHIPIETADYALTNYSDNGGSKDATTNHDGYFEIPLNATGLGWINIDGYTKLALVTSDDVAGDAPETGSDYMMFHSSEKASPPVLIIEYYVPTGTPVVGDPTFSNTKATYTKATANVTDDGGGYEERGFEYGTSEVATWAVRETGVWGATGNYSLVLPNLLPLTTYYVRAYVTNSYGTDYSDWTSFATTDVPSYGLYEEDNTATISFYISEDDGKTWGQKHGPYTTDQADIEITKLLVRGSGKKKIKFESNVLTGISASIMCKLDLKAR